MPTGMRTYARDFGKTIHLQYACITSNLFLVTLLPLPKKRQSAIISWSKLDELGQWLSLLQALFLSMECIPEDLRVPESFILFIAAI